MRQQPPLNLREVRARTRSGGIQSDGEEELTVDGREVPHVEIAGYLLGKLEPEEAAAFEAHLAGCGRCQQHLEDLERLPELLARAAPERPVPAGLRAEVLLAVRAAAEAEAPPSG
jgi:anti-sigma factor RsiW